MIQFICRLIYIGFISAMVGVVIYGVYHGLGTAK